MTEAERATINTSKAAFCSMRRTPDLPSFETIDHERNRIPAFMLVILACQAVALVLLFLAIVCVVK